MDCSGDPYFALIDSKEVELEEEKPKFKVGDKVKIIRKSMGSYLAPWVSDMDKFIGGIFQISGIRENIFQIISFPYWLPFECAELVEEGKKFAEMNAISSIKPWTIDGSIEFYHNGERHFILNAEGNVGGLCPSVKLDITKKVVDEKPKMEFTVPKVKNISIEPKLIKKFTI